MMTDQGLLTAAGATQIVKPVSIMSQVQADSFIGAVAGLYGLSCAWRNN